MRYVIIATHGNLSKGIQDALSLFMNVDEHVKFINAFMDEQNLHDLVGETMLDIPDEAECIVVTDMVSGSVTREFIQYLNRSKLYLVTGFNFPLVLEILTLPQHDQVTHEKLKMMVERAKEEVLVIDEEFIRQKLNQETET